MRGWRGRIGFLWPHDGLNDDEFWAYLPDGVALLTARFATEVGETTLGLAELARYAEIEPLEWAAKLLEATRPGVLALGDHAGSSVRGAGWDREQCAAISKAGGGAPATTMSTAVVAALATMGVRAVSVASPYTTEVTERCAGFLEAHGIRIAKLCAAALATEWAIGLAPPERWYAFARGADHADAQAIVLAGGGVRSASILARLEEDTGKPVVSGPGALIWHAARLMRVSATRADRGRLFSHYGDSPAPHASEYR